MGNMFLYPVPKSSYEYVKDDPTLIFVSHKVEASFAGSFACTDSRKISTKIPCRYIPCQSRTSPYLIIFFHGNSEDIGCHLSYLLTAFGERFGMNILCPEYPGYGIYKKKNNELRMDEAIMQDAHKVIEYCHNVMRFDYDKIILMGRSLGTGVVTQLASEYRLRGAILISPFTSIRETAEYLVGKVLSKVVPDVFASIDYVKDVKCPLLIIHGQQDTLIPHSMAIELYRKANQPKMIRINEHMTHNQFKLESDVFLPIHAFMQEKLKIKGYLGPLTDVTSVSFSFIPVVNIDDDDTKDMDMEIQNAIDDII